MRIYVHPLPVRIWHWTNALGFVALILTGVQIRYVDLIGLLSFRDAVHLHNAIGFVLIANFFLWLLFYLFTDKIRVYHPELDPEKRFRSHSSTPVTNCSGTSSSMMIWYVMLCSALNFSYTLRWCGFGSPLKMP